jgi:head-tail adaptor
MRIGSLDTPIRIERPVAGENSDWGGEVGNTWTTEWVTSAEITDVTSRMQEETKQDLRLLKRPCRVRTRYNPNITANMRIIVLDRDNRILQIVSKPAEIGRKEALEFMCEDYSV